MMNLYLTCVAFTALWSVCTASPFTDCDSTTGRVISVEVNGCPDSQDFCILNKGTAAEITIKFVSQVNSTDVKAVVHGVIKGIPIPFPIPQPDACKTGVTCPVENGNNYTYDMKLPIKKSYPPIEVTVKYQLKDDTHQDMVCVEIPCKIQ